MSRPRLPIIAWVAFGSALGASARYGLGLLLGSYPAPGFGWTTFTANALGSLAIGLFAALSAPEGRLALAPAQRQFVMSGLCGGFTTFSMFSAEVMAAVLDGQSVRAAVVLAASVPAWLLGVWAGYALGERISGVHGLR